MVTFNELSKVTYEGKLKQKLKATWFLAQYTFPFPKQAFSTTSCLCEQMPTQVITWEIADNKNLRCSQEEENTLGHSVQRAPGTMKTQTRDQYELGSWVFWEG